MEEPRLVCRVVGRRAGPRFMMEMLHTMGVRAGGTTAHRGPSCAPGNTCCSQVRVCYTEVDGVLCILSVCLI